MALPEYEHFARHVDEAVQLTVGERLLDAQIAEVKALNRQPDQARQPFSLLLVTQADDPPAQQLMRLEHGELGAVDLFLVPVGPRDGGMAYEAVFA